MRDLAYWRRDAIRTLGQDEHVGIYSVTLVFMEPSAEIGGDVLGLDINAVPELQSAIHRIQAGKRAADSVPLELFEGGFSYAMLVPAKSYWGQSRLKTGANSAQSYVLLWIQASQIRPPIMPDYQGFRLVLHHKDYEANSSEGDLLNIQNQTSASKIFLSLYY